MLSDPLPPPDDEDLLFLGIAHHACMHLARERIRSKRVVFPETLPFAFIKPLSSHEDVPDMGLPARVGDCPFCQDRSVRLSKEDIYPKWLLRELSRRGAGVRKHGRLTTKIIGPTIPVCRDCNNTWMSTIENDVKDLITALVDQTRVIDRREQELLALWATKVALLLDAASDNPVIPRGFGHDLRIHKRPHAGVHVWTAAYVEPTDTLAVRTWRIMAEDEDRVTGLLITFTIPKIAFQVFFPFFDGELARLEDFADSVFRLWPPEGRAIDWPPAYYFDGTSLPALSKRIYDNRSPVEMQVNLNRAKRLPPKPAE
jgi:hypothetical protein